MSEDIAHPAKDADFSWINKISYGKSVSTGACLRAVILSARVRRAWSAQRMSLRERRGTYRRGTGNEVCGAGDKRTTLRNAEGDAAVRCRGPSSRGTIVPPLQPTRTFNMV